MGLLDDAIREHLELKRLSGADPGVVAREEHDALGPVLSRGKEEHEAYEDGEVKHSPEADGSFPDAELSPAADSSAAGQETVEINMEAELEAGADSGRGSQTMGPDQTAPVTHSADAQPSAEDSLEWEVPSDHPSEPASDSGLDGKGDPQVEEGSERDEHVEDMLEETPDFLRDTPEQERLWFEQRPPRDFDFNE
jgi:hypothetical protein